MGNPFAKTPDNPLRHVQTTLCLAFICINWPLLALRLYVRGIMIQALGWDDYCMAVAVVGIHV
jgi:hypothetical protein